MLKYFCILFATYQRKRALLCTTSIAFIFGYSAVFPADFAMRHFLYSNHFVLVKLSH